VIRVISHDPDWVTQFHAEASRIAEATGDSVVHIHHIGSTAIPHTKAKPIIDILLEVRSLDSVDEKESELVALGYEAKGEFGISGRRYFRLNDSSGTRIYQVHAYEAGTPNVARHVAFRDYMQAHPSVAVEYGVLKEALAIAATHDMTAYIAGKDAFVTEHERRALLWAGSQPRGTRRLQPT